MYFTREALQADRNLRAQWSELWANRNINNAAHDAMLAAHRSRMTLEMLACNAVGGLGRDFWAELDRQVIQLRDQEVGMEIVNDLMGVQTALPIGKTAKLYNIVGDIAKDVAISMDGQAPYSFDHTEYDSDGDPIPVFTAGYGVNWRHAAGLNTVGLDLVLDSQAAKLRQYNKQVVGYMLNGSDRIKVQSYSGQGLKNHRNTQKLDLGAGGANIDLTTAAASSIIAFFTTGAFGNLARTNEVMEYDVMWVSPEIFANLSQPYLVEINSGANGVISGSVLQAVLPFAPVREIRKTFALKDNEFIAYQRRRDVVSPLVGMATGVVPLPRPLPQTNYNFQIMGAFGLQITRDASGKSGVVYGAEL